jgi:hypothetical protein
MFGWLVADGWFVLREKYCWLVADKPSEHGVNLQYVVDIFQILNLHIFVDRGGIIHPNTHYI